MFDLQRKERKQIKTLEKQSKYAETLSHTYYIDIISFLLMLGAFIYLTTILTQFSQSEDAILQQFANEGQIAISLALIGLMFYLLINQLKTKKSELIFRGYSEEDFQQTLLPIGVGFFSIAILNFLLFQSVVLPKYSISGFDYFFFVISMAIVEEIFFTFLAQITFEVLTNSWIIGIIARAFLFMLYHLAVYGDDPKLLISTLISGFIFALMFRWSRRITTNIMIHVIINALALGFTFAIA